MTVAEMGERMSSQEFIEWDAYYALLAQQEELEMKKLKGG